MRRKALIWGGAALAGTLAIGALMLYFGYGRSHAPPKVQGGAVEVDWPAGLDSEQAATRLVELGLAESPGTLSVFFTATGGTGEFVPGPHLLPYGATPWDLRRMLGRSFFRPGVKCTIPEGFNRFDIAARLEKLHIAGKRGFLAASADPALLIEAGVDAVAGAAPRAPRVTSSRPRTSSASTPTRARSSSAWCRRPTSAGRPCSCRARTAWLRSRPRSAGGGARC